MEKKTRILEIIQIWKVPGMKRLPVIDNLHFLNIFLSYLVILADVSIFFPAVVLFFAQQKLQLQDKVRWLSTKRYQVLKFFLTIVLSKYFRVTALRTAYCLIH